MVATTAIGIWNIVQAGTISFAATLSVVIIAAAALLWQREQKNRPVIPWGARMRVERAKAHTEILQEQLKQDATEVKRLALDHQREQVLAAIQEGDTPTVMALGLPQATSNAKAENGDWTPSLR